MDTVLLAGRLLVSLGVVLAVIWLIARRARRSGRGQKANLIEVLDRTPLSRSASVAVVRVGDRAIIVGIAESQVSVLGETDSVPVLADPGPMPTRRAARRSAATRSAHRSVARTTRTASDPVAARPTSALPATGGQSVDGQTSALVGSALSLQTWRQTIESLRDLTTRV